MLIEWVGDVYERRGIGVMKGGALEATILARLRMERDSPWLSNTHGWMRSWHMGLPELMMYIPVGTGPVGTG